LSLLNSSGSDPALSLLGGSDTGSSDGSMSLADFLTQSGS
jgi:hypothetical protein